MNSMMKGFSNGGQFRQLGIRHDKQQPRVVVEASSRSRAVDEPGVSSQCRDGLIPM